MLELTSSSAVRPSSCSHAGGERMSWPVVVLPVSSTRVPSYEHTESVAAVRRQRSRCHNLSGHIFLSF